MNDFLVIIINSIISPTIAFFLVKSWIEKRKEKWKFEKQKEFEEFKDILYKQNMEISHKNSKEIEILKAELNFDKKKSQTHIKKEFLIYLSNFNNTILHFLKKENIINIKNVIKKDIESLYSIIEKWEELNSFYKENIWAIDFQTKEELDTILSEMGSFSRMIDKMIYIRHEIDNYSKEDITNKYLDWSEFKATYRNKILPMFENLKEIMLVHPTN